MSKTYKCKHVRKMLYEDTYRTLGEYVVGVTFIPVLTKPTHSSDCKSASIIRIPLRDILDIIK